MTMGWPFGSEIEDGWRVWYLTPLSTLFQLYRGGEIKDDRHFHGKVNMILCGNCFKKGFFETSKLFKNIPRQEISSTKFSFYVG